MDTVVTLSTAGLFAAAGYSDIRTRRIPNALSLSIIALGLYRLTLAGDALATLAAAAAVFLVGFLLFWHRLLGGGDVKLMTGAALLVGYHGLFGFLVVMSLCGAMLSLALVTAAKLRQPAAADSERVAPGKAAADLTVPYGVAIAAAVIATLVLQSIAR